MAEAHFPLDEAAAHHLLRVLRRGVGDEIDVFDGQGRSWRARLASTRPAAVVLGDFLGTDPLPPVQLGLAQCLSTAEKMDWTIEKAVELGVSHIVPLLSARSVVKLDGARAEKRLQHWERLVVAAAMQCGRSRLPTLSPIQPLDRWLEGMKMGRVENSPSDNGPGAAASTATLDAHAREAALTPGGLTSSGLTGWVLDPTAGSSLFHQARQLAPVIRQQPADTLPTLWLLCGPESGLSDAETSRARAAGWQGALLGPRVLRTETAGLVGLTVLQTTLGDLA